MNACFLAYGYISMFFISEVMSLVWHALLCSLKVPIEWVGSLLVVKNWVILCVGCFRFKLFCNQIVFNFSSGRSGQLSLVKLLWSGFQFWFSFASCRVHISMLTVTALLLFLVVLLIDELAKQSIFFLIPVLFFWFSYQE